MHHELTTDLHTLIMLAAGVKTFDIRLNTHDFHEGDTIAFSCPESQIKKAVFVKIVFVQRGGIDGLEGGYLCLGFIMLSIVPILKAGY